MWWRPSKIWPGVSASFYSIPATVSVYGNATKRKAQKRKSALKTTDGEHALAWLAPVPSGPTTAAFRAGGNAACVRPGRRLRQRHGSLKLDAGTRRRLWDRWYCHVHAGGKRTDRMQIAKMADAKLSLARGAIDRLRLRCTTSTRVSLTPAGTELPQNVTVWWKRPCTSTCIANGVDRCARSLLTMPNRAPKRRCSGYCRMAKQLQRQDDEHMLVNLVASVNGDTSPREVTAGIERSWWCAARLARNGAVYGDIHDANYA